MFRRETWFVGAAESLTDFLEFDEPPPENPEDHHLGKGWVRKRFRGPSYSETVDQPSMTATMDLSLIKKRCPAFARLCRTLENHAGS